MLYLSLFITASIVVILTRNKNIKTKTYALIGLIFIVIYTFRSYSLGIADIERVYLVRFNRLALISFKQIFTQNLGAAFGSMPWSVFTKISLLIDDDFRYFLFLNSVIVVTSTFVFIGKKSHHWFLSVFVFSMVYFQYSVYMLRHFVALSFILLFLCVENNRPLKILFAMLSVAVHVTALVFYVVYYGIRYINRKLLFKVLVCVASVVILFFGNELVSLILPIISKSYFALWSANIYSSGNISVVMVMFFLFCGIPLVGKKSIGHIDKLFLFSIPVLLSMGIAEDFYRMSFFLSEPYMLLLFDKITVARIKPKWLVRGIYYVIFVMFFVYMGIGNNILPYRFG